MLKWHRRRAILFINCFLLASASVLSQRVEDFIDVSIHSEAQTLKAGEGTRIFVSVRLAEGWHIYSKSSGESGYPTTIEWDFLEGVKLSETIFPEPVLYESDGISSNVHKGSFFLKSELEIDANSSFEDNVVRLNGNFSALVCSAERCIPFEQGLVLEIPLAEKTVLNDLTLVKTENIPTKASNVPNVRATPKLRIESGFNQLMVMFGLVLIAMAIWIYGKTVHVHKPTLATKVGKLLAFVLFALGIWTGFPSYSDDSGNQIEWTKWSPEKEKSLLAEGRAVFIDFTARWCASCQLNKRVYKMDDVIDKFKDLNVVALQADWTKRGTVILEALQKYGREGVPLYIYHPPIKSDQTDNKAIILPEILTQKIVLSALAGGDSFFQSPGDSFVAILGFAFLGGVILNLMPCVFPVLGLKIMAFVKQAGEDPVKVRIHGIIFTIGVILSFWILVGVLLGLRESLGENIGWGFQLQEPVFVFCLAVFLLIFALSLSGVFEFGMSMTGVGGKLSQKSGYLGSFFSGFLATVVATPCMAPFLGVAVGAALAMPWLSSFTVFTCIAMGLSTPYLALSIFPNWISRLPKPGAWMDTLKQAMAFPLYATVAWLLWTLNSLI
jgi:DsbC/DsbD-like thiol-disulfide interchange protein/cytochrome c biogenesis protein CcdA